MAQQAPGRSSHGAFHRSPHGVRGRGGIACIFLARPSVIGTPPYTLYAMKKDLTVAHTYVPPGDDWGGGVFGGLGWCADKTVRLVFGDAGSGPGDHGGGTLHSVSNAGVSLWTATMPRRAQYGLAIDGDGNTYVSTLAYSLPQAIEDAFDNGAGLIRVKITGHGLDPDVLADIGGVTGTTEANGIWPIVVFDADHFDLVGSAFVNAYVLGGTVTQNASNIVKVDPAGSILADASLSWAGEPVGPFMRLWVSQGVLYGADMETQQVVKIDPATLAVTGSSIGVNAASYEFLHSLRVSPLGDGRVAGGGSGDGSQTYFSVIDVPALSSAGGFQAGMGTVGDVRGVDYDADGNFYVSFNGGIALPFETGVYKFDPTGAELWFAADLAADSGDLCRGVDGRIYVYRFDGNNAIRALNATTGAVEDTSALAAELAPVIGHATHIAARPTLS
jgi:hypothetical protein